MKINEDTYEIAFDIFDDAYWYDYEELYDLTSKDMLIAEQRADANESDRYVYKLGFGTAVVDATNLSDRSTYKIQSYHVNRTY